MDRPNYYHKQEVTAADLNKGVEYADQCCKDLALGTGLADGIQSCQGVIENTPTANMSVIIPGPFYGTDSDGNTIRFLTNQTIDLTLDSTGAPTAVTTAGNEKYISIFVKHKVVYSEPAIDGFNNSIFFCSRDDAEFVIIAGTEAPAGSAVPVPNQTLHLRIADILIDSTTTAITAGNIDESNKQWTFNGFGITAGTIPDAMEQLVALIGATGPGLIAQLASTTPGTSGAWLIGVEPLNGFGPKVGQTPAFTPGAQLTVVIQSLLTQLEQKVTCDNAIVEGSVTSRLDRDTCVIKTENSATYTANDHFCLVNMDEGKNNLEGLNIYSGGTGITEGLVATTTTFNNGSNDWTSNSPAGHVVGYGQIGGGRDVTADEANLLQLYSKKTTASPETFGVNDWCRHFEVRGHTAGSGAGSTVVRQKNGVIKFVDTTVFTSGEGLDFDSNPNIGEAVTENALYAKNICKSWGSVVAGGGSGLFAVDGFNTGLITPRFPGNIVEVNFATAMSNTFYSVTATSLNPDVKITVDSKTLTSFTLVALKQNLATGIYNELPAASEISFDFQVFGRQDS